MQKMKPLMMKEIHMSANLNKFEGVWTAIVSPFTNDGSVDFNAWESLLSIQKEGGVRGVVVAGTTGEGPTLSVSEKLALTKKAKALVGKDLLIMGGISSSDTAQCVELAKLYEDAGADCLLVVTPPYNKPSLAGLQIHFSKIAEKVKIPLCLYHVPGRTNHRLDAKMLKALCSIPKVQMVKEASGDLALFSEALIESDALFLTGDDPTYLPSLSVGGKGVISVVTNIFPREFVALTEAFGKGDHAKALALHNALSPMIKALFCETNPTPLKAALAELKLCNGFVRPPLATVSPEHHALICETLKKVQQNLKGLSYA